MAALLSRQVPYFKVWRSTPAHTNNIVNYIDEPHRDFADLIREVFFHQRAVFPGSDGRDGGEKPKTRDPSVLAAHFYETCYRKPKLHYGYGVEGSEASVDAFVKRVILSDEQERRNKLFYLIGNVGVGKTALVNYLISRILPAYVQQGRIWFLALDLERVMEGVQGGAELRLEPAEVFRQLVVKTSRVLEQNAYLTEGNERAKKLAAELFGGRMDASSKEEEYLQLALNFTKFVNAIGQIRERRLILIFDNIDYIVHLADRGLYRPENRRNDMPIISDLIAFVRTFVHPRELGHLGANVLFVTRSDSYKILTQQNTISLPPMMHQDVADAFTLASPDWNEILDARTDLIKYAAKLEPASRRTDDFIEAISAIKGHLACAPEAGATSLLGHLKAITNAGLREAMRFFAQYGWIGGKETGFEGPIHRFLHQYPVGLLTFMLNQKCRFHQTTSRFPNVYLVFIPPGEGPITNYEHRHTYWLKRLVLGMVCSEVKTHPDEIVKIFHDDGKGYEEHLIYEVLGSLTESNGSNCIFAERSRHPRGSELQFDYIGPTLRGTHCLNEIFDKFFYLQLIVDDSLLPIPRVVWEEFDFDRHRLDYHYVAVTDEAEYGKAAREMIRLKARQVLVFLEVLESSLEIETELYSGVFQHLRLLNVDIPNVSKIRLSVIRELNALNAAQRRPFMTVELVRRAAHELRPKINDWLQEAYAAGHSH
ncbi:MAG: hypothetical protein HY644_02520 [Acidobacteria bacterium]|nr:hypothetical protein [Acidobacteriota bacterium]